MNTCSHRPSQFFVTRVHNILQITDEPICAQRLIDLLVPRGHEFLSNSFFQIPLGENVNIDIKETCTLTNCYNYQCGISACILFM